MPGRNAAYRIAALATVLLVINTLIAEVVVTLAAMVFSRFVIVLTVWIVAIVVTNYRQADQLQRRSQRQNQQYLDIVSVAVLVLDRDGRVRLMNRRGLEWLGAAERDLIGHSWIDEFVPADDQASWRQTLGAVLAGSVQHTSRVVRKDGETRVIAWSTVVLHDEDGAVSGTLSSGEDITAQLSAERALRASVKDSEDIRHALDQSAIVATTNVQGDITSVNDKFCEISKYSRQELIGRNHRILNSDFHPVEFFKEMYATIANGRVWRGEIRNRAKDGSLYWVDTTIVPFVDERSKPYQYIAIRYDITERKTSEAALREQESLAGLGKMAAIVAHEVRNPIAGIRGALQIIGRRMPADSQEHGIVNEVVGRLDTLNAIVEDLLVFARPRSPVIAPVSMRSLVSEAVSLVRADPKFAHIELRVDVPETTISADRDQMKQVLMNLLINAEQAMQGRGAIVISGARVGACHELRVADHGPGITPDIRRQMFQPFFTTKHRGTGLGLATARRVVEAHGGSIDLSTPAEGGAVATIRLPDR